LTTFETVGSETPASAAMAASVVRRPADPRASPPLEDVAILSGSFCSAKAVSPSRRSPRATRAAAVVRNYFDIDIVGQSTFRVTTPAVSSRFPANITGNGMETMG
jgi:hypothetical protein